MFAPFNGRINQIEVEIDSKLQLIHRVYSIFEFNYTLELSIRSESFYIGDVEAWSRAESTLSSGNITQEMADAIKENPKGCEWNRELCK